jgi:xylulose-5-phosphate/fructose-6-phosphate phosphoketolase
VVLPILHLNGYKIASPTVLARIPRQELESLLSGYGWQPYFVAGDEPWSMHAQMAQTLDRVFDQIAVIRERARGSAQDLRPRWPMIVLQSPKGWTGPKIVDGVQIEGTWRAHQVPLAQVSSNPTHLRQLEEWMRSYGPQELFDPRGAPTSYLLQLAPAGTRRMGSNPHANGGRCAAPLKLPPVTDLAVAVERPGRTATESTRVLGCWLREILRLNAPSRNFRLFGPDETSSNRLEAVFEATGRTWMAELQSGDNHLSPDGRVMEVLSEHQCQGWLEGYLLTGRHGLFSCYEAFIHVVDSMFNQHAKWLEAASRIPWRQAVPSLNILLTSHVWRQDHNGFSHQDPGFIDVVLNKKAGVVRVYLPPDANTLLCVADHCLRSYNRVNVIVAGKNIEPQWLSMDAALRHCDAGIGIFEFASNDADGSPDLVMACAGDVPTLETLAAVDLLHRHVPDLKIRVVNVVDLMTLQPKEEHPHGLSDAEFDALFTTDRPVIFAYHGYPWLVHRLTYRRHNHENLHVRGYKEEGSTTTPFDMVVRNDLDRFHLVIDVIDRVPGLGYRAAHVRQIMRDKLAEHSAYIRRKGEDLPEVSDWLWPSARGAKLP